jgi:hypothetical protein
VQGLLGNYATRSATTVTGGKLFITRPKRMAQLSRSITTAFPIPPASHIVCSP